MLGWPDSPGRSAPVKFTWGLGGLACLALGIQVEAGAGWKGVVAGDCGNSCCADHVDDRAVHGHDAVHRPQRHVVERRPVLDVSWRVDPGPACAGQPRQSGSAGRPRQGLVGRVVCWRWGRRGFGLRREARCPGVRLWCGPAQAWRWLPCWLVGKHWECRPPSGPIDP